MTQDEFISALLTLLDLIEVEEDWKLAKDRFEIMKQYGTVEITGSASSRVH